MATENLQRTRNKELKHKLKKILELTGAINKNVKSSELFALYGDILENDLKVSKSAFIANLNGEWKTTIKIGCSLEITPELIRALDKHSDIGNLQESSIPDLLQFDLVIPIKHKSKFLGFLLLQDKAEETNRVSTIIRNLNFIQSTANIIMVAIENKRMAKIQLEQEGFKRELSLAKQIQKALFPKDLPNDDRIEVQAFHQSYGDVGGDYYDFLQASPTEYYFCIADISGKGISAAILMSNFQATFRSGVRQNLPLTALIPVLNKSVIENSSGDKFITFFVGKYDATNKELEYVNCAHPSALLINEKRIIELKADIPGLGMLEDLPQFVSNSIVITKESVLACYTDGITELENAQGESFGTQRLKESISNYNNLSLSGMISHVSETLNTYAIGSRTNDDIAALAIHFKE